MPSYRPADEQAKHIVMKMTRHGTSRRSLTAEDRIITSISTEVKYRGNIKRLIQWLRERRLFIQDLTPALAKQFLLEKHDVLTQKTLDGYRQSILLVCGIEVEYVCSTRATVLVPRAYTGDQISLLQSRASRDLSLATQIALEGGLRPHELHTISRADELQEDNRPWLKERFAGRENTRRYVVIGKGGLRRSVLLNAQSADALEAMRLPEPVIKRDREINYLKRYSILGGQSLSQQFSALCKETLGWSEGVYGLRHRFAKDRLRALQILGFKFNTAVEVLAQEMGHFSTANTLTYLR